MFLNSGVNLRVFFLRQQNDENERGGDRIKSEGRKKFGSVPEYSEWEQEM